MRTFESFGIKVPAGATDSVKTTCPECTPHKRKPHNRNAKDLSVNVKDGIWLCHNTDCGWTGTLKEKSEPKKEFKRPPTITLSMDEKMVSWFRDKRGISESTLHFFGIGSKLEWMPKHGKEMNCIVFPYNKNGEVANLKFRDGNKGFKLVSGAELLLWNYDGLMGKKRAVLTEGEIDALSVHETGWDLASDCGVGSVPNGASLGNQRLEYLDNSWECLEAAEIIILATDGDDPGFSLKQELIRRLGRDRCYEIKYPAGCKDLNEVLILHGKQAVIDVISGAEPLPLEGILTLREFEDEIDDLYNNGYERGATIGYDDFDRLLNFSPGQCTVITGIPNSGKSAFVDQIILRLASREKWKFGLCSFENQPYRLHVDKLASNYIGMPMSRKNPLEKMNPEQFQIAKNFLNDNFYWFKMKNEDISIDGILERAKGLVKQKGINGLLIDPYNYIDHGKRGNQSETDYISELLSKIDRFCEDFGVHTFLIAHPKKMNKDAQTKKYEVPTLYDIAGSANFFNKPDNGISVYRDPETNLVTVYVQKVRFFMNGQRGLTSFMFDPSTYRYRSESEPNFYSEYLWGKEQIMVEQPILFDNPNKIFQNRNFEFDNSETLPF